MARKRWCVVVPPTPRYTAVHLVTQRGTREHRHASAAKAEARKSGLAGYWSLFKHDEEVGIFEVT